MTCLSLVTGGLTVAPTAMAAETAPTASTSVARPPQYVLLAFDGSLNLDFWNESLTFAQKNPLKFTYFISGVYFVMNSQKREYIEPTHGAGVSNIGWGGNSKTALQARVGYVNQAYDQGNEIGSHVNGHFDGSKWSLEQWKSEFKQFYHLIFDVFRINGIEASPTVVENPYHFKPEDIRGFRAPLLGYNSSMYEVLSENNYAYDTSRTAPMNYWPQKLKGIWNFPLAEVRIAGTGKRTLSMDYNFYYSQSGGRPNPSESEEYRKEMLNTYMGYFESNYYGNRAPIHIGHHFSKWNGGAYWMAMQEFAKNVCGLPEVRCVTYKELTKFMESLAPSTLAAYRYGHFEKMPMNPNAPSHIASVAPMDVNLAMTVNHDNTISAVVTGQHAAYVPRGNNAAYVWKVDGEEVYRTTSPTTSVTALDPYVAQGSKLSVSYQYNNRELLKTSHNVEANDGNGLQLHAEDLETRALKGDMPAAHDEMDESNHTE